MKKTIFITGNTLQKGAHMKRILILSMAVMFCFATASAQAEVTAWNYKLTGIFTQWTDENGRTGTAGNNNTTVRTEGSKISLSYDYLGGTYAPGSASGYAGLSWGNIFGRSSIGLVANSGVVTTNGERAAGVTLTHNNSPIDTSVKTLAKGIVQIVLELTPVGLGNVAQSFSTVLNFAFFETPNNGGHEDDIFVLLGNPVQPETFVHEGQEYHFTFTDSFRQVDEWYANYAREQLHWDAGVPVYGWTTTENGNTAIPTWFAVRAGAAPTPTPEPATMALMGIGLAGLGAFARRHRSNA